MNKADSANSNGVGNGSSTLSASAGGAGVGGPNGVGPGGSSVTSSGSGGASGGNAAAGGSGFHYPESSRCSRILEGEYLNTDVTSPAATVALGLLAMKSNDPVIPSGWRCLTIGFSECGKILQSSGNSVYPGLPST